MVPLYYIPFLLLYSSAFLFERAQGNGEQPGALHVSAQQQGFPQQGFQGFMEVLGSLGNLMKQSMGQKETEPVKLQLLGTQAAGGAAAGQRPDQLALPAGRIRVSGFRV